MQNYKLKFEKIISSNFLLKALLLISIKELYLFLRNLYGLAVHPFKTTVGILAKPDKSQTFLVFGLPGYLWLGVLVVFLPVFWLFRYWYSTRILLLLLFYSFTFLLFLFTCYLIFWFFQHFFRCKLRPKN